MSNTVSLCMIVRNEEDYLPKCLESIKDIVDEIIIVDTGSTDKTIEIAKFYGAKDWILILDADDELRVQYKENLKLLLNSQLDEKTIYFFETLSFYGDTIDNNCITVNLNPRLFKTNRDIYYEGEIHNQFDK